MSLPKKLSSFKNLFFNNFEQEKTDFSGAVELERPPKALIAEGDKLFINGKLDQALQLYNEVLQRDPTDHAGLVARSRCYTQVKISAFSQNFSLLKTFPKFEKTTKEL